MIAAKGFVHSFTAIQSSPFLNARLQLLHGEQGGPISPVDARENRIGRDYGVLRMTNTPASSYPLRPVALQRSRSHALTRIARAVPRFGDFCANHLHARGLHAIGRKDACTVAATIGDNQREVFGARLEARTARPAATNPLRQKVTPRAWFFFPTGGIILKILNHGEHGGHGKMQNHISSPCRCTRFSVLLFFSCSPWGSPWFLLFLGEHPALESV
jgi:hypothetical protein